MHAAITNEVLDEACGPYRLELSFAFVVELPVRDVVDEQQRPSTLRRLNLRNQRRCGEAFVRGVTC